MPRKTLLLSAALLAATACLPLHARTLVDIDLVDRDSGRVLPEYGHHGRIHVPGEPGRDYTVRLRNQSGERVLVVLSVDGVNAVTGQTAAPSQAGYVLGPWESADIAGWRKSLDDVARFYFTDLPDSYAARTGRPGNVGVVGIAVFRERQRHLPYPLPGPPVAPQDGFDRDEARAAAPSSAREAATADAIGNAPAPRSGAPLGTGHGAREWAPVGQTRFDRASRRPAQVTELHYDDARTLVALGVMPPAHGWPHWPRREPMAFPNGFVADPPGW